MDSGAALDESCLVRELLVDVPENPALQGMDLEPWALGGMISGEPRKQPSYNWLFKRDPYLIYYGLL